MLFLLKKLLLETFSWLIFGILFVIPMEKLLNLKGNLIDNIYQGIFGREKNFVDYFLGKEGKDELLNYASIIIIIIIFLKFFSLLMNIYLRKKNKYIESNIFYLRQKGIFIVNSLTQLLCCVLLTLSFVSIYTIIITLIFISFNTWIKKQETIETENFLIWKNQYVRKILFWSMFVIFTFPFIIGFLKDFTTRAEKNQAGELGKAYLEMSQASPQIKRWIDFAKKGSYVIHWIVLVWWATNTFNQRIGEFNNFWKKIDDNKKQIINLKHFYYYRNMLDKKERNIYFDNYLLQIIPYFLRENYLEKELIDPKNELVNFEREIRQVIVFLNVLEKKISDQKKRNFLGHCLLNEFRKIQDLERVQKLVTYYC